MIATAFLIRSPSNLQIMRTGIKFQTSILAQFQLLIDLGKCCVNNHFIFYRIFIRLAGKEDSHKILDKFSFGADLIIHMRVTCPLVSHRRIMGKMFSRR